VKPPLECGITADDAGAPLIDALMRKFPSYKRAEWLAVATDGCLFIDGARTNLHEPAIAGTRVIFQPPECEEPVVDDSYSIVFEDEHIAVVNKSGNLPCHPAGRYFENSLSRMLVARNGFDAAFMVNRIDRETSGIVLVAKTTEAASRCGQDLMAGRFEKKYLVLVAGCWTLPREHTATGSIRLERGEVVRKKRVFAQDGAGAVCTTKFRLLSVDAERDLSLLEAEPVTGRPHQIRATLKALGHPVAGDKLYGPDETIYARLRADTLTPADITALSGFPRQCLHSWRLAFPHPFTRAEISFEAPLSAEW